MGRIVPAVARALDVLELFLGDHETLSTPEIVARLGLPRTTGHELVTTLVARSWLAPVPGAPGRFRLGVRSFQLGSAYAGRLDLAREGRAVAEEVAAARDETVHVAILDEMVAAMSISVPTSRWSAERKQRWAALVAEGAAALSTQLGHGRREARAIGGGGPR